LQNLSRAAFFGVDNSGRVSDICANDETRHRHTPPRQPSRQPADRALLPRGNPAHRVRFAQAAGVSERHRAADHSALLRTNNKEVATAILREAEKKADKTKQNERKKDMNTTKQSNMSDHGTVEHGDKTLVLTQDAYPTSGSFPVPGGATYTGDWYEAHAVDAGGTDYRVIWTDVDYETEDESEACDWDDPDYVLEA